jgi:26S proteasome regulatory subunit N3
MFALKRSTRVVSFFRRISLAYSCISLADVAKKLRLDSPMDAEYIIAKVNTGSFLSCMDHPLTLLQSGERLGLRVGPTPSVPKRILDVIT